MDKRQLWVTAPVCAAILASFGVLGCDEEQYKGPPADEEVVPARKEADLVPDEHLEKQPETAEELAEEQDLVPDPEPPPKTVEEMRDEADLHP